MTAYAYVDVSNKQQFIYRHNKLRRNLYNSLVIKVLTEEFEEFDHGEYPGVTLKKHLSDCRGNPRFVYSGGGNSIIEFDSLEDAQGFVRSYTLEVLKALPNLELYISLVDESEVKDASNRMQAIREILHQKSDKLKEMRKAQFKRWSYGIELMDETGLPALVKKDTKDEWMEERYSRESLHHKFEKTFESRMLTNLVVTNELKDFKKTGDGKSYIGVICIDGNKMGEIVSRMSTFEQLRKFSKMIDELYLEAIVKGLATVAGSAVTRVIPIVQAGDDLCIIVEAELALQAAAEIVRSIEELSKEERYFSHWHSFLKEESSLKACAGVAIARYNYPFFELIRRAESRCKRAKESIYKLRTDNRREVNASFIDWEIVQTQADGGREYEEGIRHGRYQEIFHVKPLRLDTDDAVNDGVYGFDSFMEITTKIMEATKSEDRDKRISNSLLESLKPYFYSGYEQYKLNLEMKQTEETKNLIRLVSETYKNAHLTVISGKNENGITVHTYVLNDVLDLIPFIKKHG